MDGYDGADIRRRPSWKDAFSGSDRVIGEGMRGPTAGSRGKCRTVG